MRLPWRAVLGFGLSAALLYWVFKGVTWSEVGAQMRASDPWLWVLAVVLSQSIFLLRARRWRTILDGIAPHVAFAPLWQSTAIGMMANNVLPARLGEVARAYMLSRMEPRVSFTPALASLVVDRACDAVVLLLLLVIALFDPTFTPANAADGAASRAVIVSLTTMVIAAFAVLYFTVLWPDKTENIATSIARRVMPRLEQRIQRMVHNVAAGLGVLRDPRRLSAVMLWTVAHWLVNAAAFWVAFKAVGLNVPFSAALFVQAVVAAGVALPSMPAFIGVFEAFAVVALARYGIPQSEAVGWALAYHGLTLIPITLLGAWYLARMGMSLGQLRHTQSDAVT